MLFFFDQSSIDCAVLLESKHQSSCFSAIKEILIKKSRKALIPSHQTICFRHFLLTWV
jgi:hypothetical protein